MKGMGHEQELQKTGKLGSLKCTPSPVGVNGKGSILAGLRPVVEGAQARLEEHTLKLPEGWL